MTVSDDGKLKVWDTNNHKLIKSINLTIDKAGKEVPMDTYWKTLTDQY